MIEKVREGLKSLTDKNKHHYFKAKLVENACLSNSLVKSLTAERQAEKEAIYRIELFEEMTFYKAFKSKRPDPTSNLKTQIVSDIYSQLGQAQSLEWIISAPRPLDKDILNNLAAKYFETEEEIKSMKFIDDSKTQLGDRTTEKDSEQTQLLDNSGLVASDQKMSILSSSKKR